MPRPSSTNTSQTGHNVYNPPRAVEVYALGEVANSSMPVDVRAQFHCDDLGRVLFFTIPPLNSHDSEDKADVKHSLRYLAAKARRKDALKRKRDSGDLETGSGHAELAKHAKTTSGNLSIQLEGALIEPLQVWSEKMESDTDDLYKKMYGDDWKQNRRHGK